MKTSISFFIIFLLSFSLCSAEPQSNILLFIPAIIATTPNTEVQPRQIYSLAFFEGGMEACKTGYITHAKEFRTLSNSDTQIITIVEMTIIDPATWQFENTNSLPITLAPGDTVTYSISHIAGYLCENPPNPEARVKFVFADGNFQKV